MGQMELWHKSAGDRQKDQETLFCFVLLLPGGKNVRWYIFYRGAFDRVKITRIARSIWYNKIRHINLCHSVTSRICRLKLCICCHATPATEPVDSIVVLGEHLTRVCIED